MTTKRRNLIVFVSLLLFLFILSACGSSGDGTKTLSGHITSDYGTSLAGVNIVIMERSINSKYKTTSLPDGSYSLEVPKGTYDVGYDLDEYVTYFAGPVDLYADAKKECYLITR